MGIWGVVPCPRAMRENGEILYGIVMVTLTEMVRRGGLVVVCFKDYSILELFVQWRDSSSF